jgi:hypothetical protein
MNGLPTKPCRSSSLKTKRVGTREAILAWGWRKIASSSIGTALWGAVVAETTTALPATVVADSIATVVAVLVPTALARVTVVKARAVVVTAFFKAALFWGGLNFFCQF